MSIPMMTFNTASPVNPRLARYQRRFAIVLRFRRIGPDDLGRFLDHDQRKDGDLVHVHHAVTHLNKIELGDPSAIPRLLARIAHAANQNRAQEVAALRARRRKADADALEAGPLSPPWHGNTDTPLREGILTVNKAWFGGTGVAAWKPDKVETFRTFAKTFLTRHFPDEQLLLASSHADEEAFHIHFLIAVWQTRYSKTRGHQQLLRPDANPLLHNYELAQDLAGDHFAPLGLVRPKRHAAARRDYKARIRAAELAGEDPDSLGLIKPEPPVHVPPSFYRAVQRERARQEADAAAAARLADWRVAMKKLRQRQARALRAQIRNEARIERKRAAETGRIAVLQETRARLSEESASLSHANACLSEEITRRSRESRLHADQVRATAERMARETRARATDDAAQIVAAARRMAEAATDAAQAKIAELIQREKALTDTCAELQRARAEMTVTLRGAKTALDETRTACVQERQALAKLHDEVETQETKRRTLMIEVEQARTRLADEKKALASLQDVRVAEEKTRETAVAEKTAALTDLEALQTRQATERERLQTLDDRRKAAVATLDALARGVLAIRPDGRIGFGAAAPKDQTARQRINANYKMSTHLVSALLDGFSAAVQTAVAPRMAALAKEARELIDMRDTMGLEPDDTLETIKERNARVAEEDPTASFEP